MSKKRRTHVYDPPSGAEEDCICSDAWRRTSPRNHSDRCASAFEAKRRAGLDAKTVERMAELEHAFRLGFQQGAAVTKAKLVVAVRSVTVGQPEEGSAWIACPLRSQP